jgi:chromosome segregation ATPase
MSTALASRMERVETKLEHLDSSVDRLIDKNDALDERVVGIDRKLDKLIYELESYNTRLGRVEKTVNDDIVPWKHFVHKLVVIMGLLATVASIVRMVQ